MKKLILAMVFVFATGGMMNANSISGEKNINNEDVILEWDCYDRADFYFEWAQICGASFDEACDASDAALSDCLG